MAAFTATCRHCLKPFEARNTRARYCSDAHRARAREANREARFRADAVALVLDIQHAAIAGDPDELAEVDRRGRELFGDDYPIAA